MNVGRKWHYFHCPYTLKTITMGSTSDPWGVNMNPTPYWVNMDQYQCLFWHYCWVTGSKGGHPYAPTVLCSHISRTFSKWGLVFLHFSSTRFLGLGLGVWLATKLGDRGDKILGNSWKRNCGNVGPYFAKKILEIWEHGHAPIKTNPLLAGFLPKFSLASCYVHPALDQILTHYFF